MTLQQILSLETANDLPNRVAGILHAAADLPGKPGDGQRLSPQRLERSFIAPRRPALDMSPELSYGRHAGPPPATARRAAVMLLLFQRGGRWHLPLTQRPAALVRHGGQISLPGGAIEPGESAERAARRELAEELGLVEPVQMLGRLPDVYVYASDFVVTPHVAATTIEPNWRPDPREVERVVELPLSALLDGTRVGRLAVRRGPLLLFAPCFEFGSDRVWGATSVMLAELAAVLTRLAE
jgi:8-oxo-dGTP pyrophosphatase MutT (NUDIX family)